MKTNQPGILAPLPPHGRFCELRLKRGIGATKLRKLLASLDINDGLVVGLGPAAVSRLGGKVRGLRSFAPLSQTKCQVPSTQTDLWLWLRGKDRGTLANHSLDLLRQLDVAFAPLSVIDGFKHDSGRDLTGYEDGTENPKGRAAVAAAIVSAGSGRSALAGSSFVSVQRWVHDMAAFAAMPRRLADNCIGRRRSDNHELVHAPASAHVKRTAQESFEPPAFLLRRSMPWAQGVEQGLMFVAFGASLRPFEVQMRRMAGLEDGIIDGLFALSRPVTGSHFWCPAVARGRLNLDL